MTLTSIEESARRLGHFRWVEQRLFEILGGWAPLLMEPEAKLILRSHSFRHAGYAEIWEKRLPRTAHLDPAEMLAPPRSSAAEILVELGSLRTTADRLKGTYEVVLPELMAGYETERPGQPAPVRRWVGVVLHEVAAEITEGRELMRALGMAGVGPSRLRELAGVPGVLAAVGSTENP